MERYSDSNVLVEPHVFAMQRFSLPAIGLADMLLRVEMVGVCGGDIIEYDGRNYKAHYPMILGHEILGHVEEIGEVASQQYGVTVGDRVSVEPYIMCRTCRYCLTGLYQFCFTSRIYGVNISSDTPPHLWGAYGNYLFVAPGSRVHRVSDTVDARAGCMASVLGNGVRWITGLAKTQPGERVLVLGAGAQGLASIVAAREAGAAEIVCITLRERTASAELAERLGARVAYTDDVFPDSLEAAFDVAVECVGVDAMLDLAIRGLRPTGRLVQAGTRGGAVAHVNMDQVVFKEIALLGGLGQSWNTEAAVGIINARRYPVEDFISHVLPVREAREALELAKAGAPSLIHIALRPN